MWIEAALANEVASSCQYFKTNSTSNIDHSEATNGRDFKRLMEQTSPSVQPKYSYSPLHWESES